MAKNRIDNRVAQIRKSRGLAASDLAKRVGVIRQTIYAVERGTYVPNTELALLLARELEVRVDELFALPPGPTKAPDSLSVEILSASAPVKGQPVRICQIGSKWVGVPVSATPYYLPEADGIVERLWRPGGRPPGLAAQLAVFAKDQTTDKRLILAGCDPATSLLSTMVERISGIEIVTAAASSKLALAWLKEDRVHIAGSHLEDPLTGEFNVPYVRQEFPDNEIVIVTFAHWEEGFVVASGNPKKIRKPEDLAQRGVHFVNREPGSGSRGLLDKLLASCGLPSTKIRGYDHVAYGHLAAAYSVVCGESDVCLATRSAAQTFNLDFVPLHGERYDLVMRKRTAELPSVIAFLDVLQRATLRRKLETLAGYDTSETGTVIAA